MLIAKFPRQGVCEKRSDGGDIAPTTRHYRSVSMDGFIGKLYFGDESPKLPPSPPATGFDGNSAAFSLEFGNGEFSGPELNKIMGNEKLAEIALTDPKRAKREILLLKFRLQSMKHHAKLRDALNEALTAEDQRLKLATAELSGDSHASSCLIPQHSVNPLMFHHHHQQPPTASQQNIHLQPQHYHHQNGNANSNSDLKL